jgi:DNA invertase Pin-like site-specific DNA recombinase
VRRLYAEGHSKSALARQLGISRTSVRRFKGRLVDSQRFAATSSCPYSAVRRAD